MVFLKQFSPLVTSTSLLLMSVDKGVRGENGEKIMRENQEKIVNIQFSLFLLTTSLESTNHQIPVLKGQQSTRLVPPQDPLL